MRFFRGLPRIMSQTLLDGPYSLNADGIYARLPAVKHRDDEFNEAQLEIYAEIEARHFWFAGRRRFVMCALRNHLPRFFNERSLSVIDLGAGTGGWIAHLAAAMPHCCSELAMADSSPRALKLASAVAGPSVARYHVDLRRLGWQDRWDIAFLLDVIEHIAEDECVLHQIARALRPGGLLFVTTPALNALRTYNDDIERHIRRYSCGEFQRLAGRCNLQLVDARYFMFLLSPVLLASRLLGPRVERMTAEERLSCYRRTHRVPWAPLNALLRFVFSLETPLGHRIRFPWGTSLLGVFRKRV